MEKCASKKETYLGYKLHMLCTLDRLVTDFVLSPANVDDRDAVWELVSSLQSGDFKTVDIFDALNNINITSVNLRQNNIGGRQ